MCTENPMDCSLIGTAASPVRHGKVSTIGKESEMDFG